MGDPFPPSRWERRFGKTVELVPYLCLATPTIISLTAPPQAGSRRLVTLGLVIVAFGWLVCARTLLPAPRRQRPAVGGVYFAGLLVTAAVLSLHDPVFLIYTISGFFLAHLFAPSKWTFAAVAATSLVLYGTVLDWR